MHKIVVDILGERRYCALHQMVQRTNLMTQLTLPRGYEHERYDGCNEAIQ